MRILFQAPVGSGVVLKGGRRDYEVRVGKKGR